MCNSDYPILHTSPSTILAPTHHKTLKPSSQTSHSFIYTHPCDCPFVFCLCHVYTMYISRTYTHTTYVPCTHHESNTSHERANMHVTRTSEHALLYITKEPFFLPTYIYLSAAGGERWEEGSMYIYIHSMYPRGLEEDVLLHTYAH